jgi:hypothetical protein
MAKRKKRVKMRPGMASEHYGHRFGRGATESELED